MTDDKIARYLESYRSLIGQIPPRVAGRFEQERDAHPELLLAQEEYRRIVMYPESLDQRTVQLVLFGILAGQLSDAAKLHGCAALRAGASMEELRAVINLAALFNGLSVSNRGPALLEQIREQMGESV